MKVKRFYQYIKEELSDTPETYVASALTNLKRKIEDMFGGGIENDDIKKISDKSKPSLKDLNLDSIELSNSPKLYDNLVVKFSDDEYMYSLYITIDLKDALPKGDDFKYSDIEKCYIEFKVYSLDEIELIGKITKNIKPSDIDEELLIQLKLDLDKEIGGGEDELQIEY